MDRDFKDLLSALNAHKVRYLIVGGYAYAQYAEPRATKDLDIFVDSQKENARAIYKALAAFGASMVGIQPEDFENPDLILQIGVAPLRVDLLGKIDGVPFDRAYAKSEMGLVDEEVPVRYISLEDLIVNKLASARPQDLVDADNLKEASATRGQK